MNIDTARAFARQLLAAADQAEAEGRDTLTTADVNSFAALDDAARAELQAVIDRKSEGND